MTRRRWQASSPGVLMPVPWAINIEDGAGSPDLECKKIAGHPRERANLGGTIYKRTHDVYLRAYDSRGPAAIEGGRSQGIELRRQAGL